MEANFGTQTRTWKNTYQSYVDGLVDGDITWAEAINEIMKLRGLAAGAVEHFGKVEWANEAVNLGEAIRQALWDLSDDKRREALMVAPPAF